MEKVTKLVLATVLTSLFLIPIVLSKYPIYNEQDWERGPILVVVGLLISCFVTWRLGAISGVASSVVIVFGTILLPLHHQNDNIFIFLLLVIAIALASLDIIAWGKYVLIILLGSLGFILYHDFSVSLVIAGAGMGFVWMSKLMKLISDESLKIFISIKGYWYPILSYLFLSAGMVTIFAFWYQFAFINWGTAAFEIGKLESILTESSWPSIFVVFLYQSVLTFATVGPPFPPNNNYARILVSLELVSSLSLAGVYLGLLFHHLSHSKENT